MDIIKGIVQQGESSQVDIHGNNNYVNINQAQNAQSGNNDGGHESNSYRVHL